MERCPGCGGKILEDMQYCPHCGENLDVSRQDSPTDYWAEKLTEEDEEWLREVDEEELEDLDQEEQIRILSGIRPPRKKSHLGAAAVLVFLLAGIFLLFRLWPGKNEALLPGAGVYYGCSNSYEGLTVENEDDWVELKEDGSFRMRLLDSPMEGTWNLEGEKFSGTMEHRQIEGTLSQGVLSFEYSGVSFLFALPQEKTRLQETRPTLPAAESRPEEKTSSWEGDYSGSMILSKGYGAWEADGGAILDVCGEIRRTEPGMGTLALWNRENKPGDRFCMAEVIFAEGTTEKGKMYPEWGKFYDMELRSGEWVVDPGKSPFSQYENTLYFFGEYQSMEDPESGFTYEIFLRPWGQSWKDLKEEFPDCFMLPPHYEDWYLPLIKGGRNMPESF